MVLRFKSLCHQLHKAFICVSAFCVLHYELTQSKQIYCHNSLRYGVQKTVYVCTTLTCIYVCVCRYVWEKSGSVIDVNMSPRLRLDPDGTLHISQTWSGDIGTYTCRVTSVGGNDSRSAHLRVRSALMPHTSFSFVS